MKHLFAILFLLTAVTAFAQKQDKPLVQFSGIIHNADSAHVIIPYVTITNISSKHQVFVANYLGYFSFVAHEQDSLTFSCVGFTPQTVVIPANLANKSYSLEMFLKPAMIHLPVFHVFPWATTDEFRKDFLTMKVADDDLEIARKNLSPKSISNLAATLPRNGPEIQSADALAMHNNIMNSHSLMPNPLLNPIAWGTFIKEITEGDKSRSKSSDSSSGN